MEPYKRHRYTLHFHTCHESSSDEISCKSAIFAPLTALSNNRQRSSSRKYLNTELIRKTAVKVDQIKKQSRHLKRIEITPEIFRVRQGNNRRSCISGLVLCSNHPFLGELRLSPPPPQTTGHLNPSAFHNLTL